jgi:dTDP-4-dehydrorhamnose 3,5-epimerase
MLQTAIVPAGVQLQLLQSRVDSRGSLTEVFREEWSDGIEPVQWNFVRSAAGVMRGVHVHVVHDDVVIVLEGQMTLGLRDVREASPTNGMSVALELSALAPTVAVIPHGVIHGFLFREPGTVLIGATSYYNPADDVECVWSDPDLKIPWPAVPTVVSDRDRAATPLSALLERIRPWQPF